MSDQTKVPRFSSEAEEARWWFDHREETAEWLEKAAKEGRTTNLSVILDRRRGATGSMVSIGIDPEDLSRARRLAERRGLKYQAYLKMILHEALQREDRQPAG